MKEKRKSISFFIFFLFLFSFLHSAVLTPIYLTLVSDVLFSNSIVLLLIEYLQLLFEYAFYWTAFAFLLFAFGKEREKCKFLAVPILLLAIPIRQALELIAGYSAFGFPAWSVFVSTELKYSLLQILLDYLILVVALLLIRFFKKSVAVWLSSGILSLLQIVMAVYAFLQDGFSQGAQAIEFSVYLIFQILCFPIGKYFILLLEKKSEKTKRKEESV